MIMKSLKLFMALSMTLGLGLSSVSFAEKSEKKNVMEKFSKEDKKWCGGRHKFGAPFPYSKYGGAKDAQKAALKACDEDSNCKAVNCPGHFKLCELLKNVDTACNGSNGDWLFMKKE
jgi:hypothetical protein